MFRPYFFPSASSFQITASSRRPAAFWERRRICAWVWGRGGLDIIDIKGSVKWEGFKTYYTRSTSPALCHTGPPFRSEGLSPAPHSKSFSRPHYWRILCWRLHPSLPSSWGLISVNRMSSKAVRIILHPPQHSNQLTQLSTNHTLFLTRHAARQSSRIDDIGGTLRTACSNMVLFS